MTSVSAASDRLKWRSAASPESAATTVIVLGSIAVLGASKGGYFPSSWGWSALFFSWSAVLALLVKRRIAVSHGEIVYLGALVAFLAWTSFSLFWTSTTTQTMYEIERTLSYVTFAVALAVIGRRLDVQVVLASVLVALTGLSAYGLLTRILPGRLTTFDTIAGYRLDTPLGYWNAVGAISTFGSIVAVGFAARARSVIVRGLAAASLTVLVPTLYFTFSRGAWLALFIGVGAMIALDPKRLQLITNLLIVAVWPVLGLWRAYESKGLTTQFSPLTAVSNDGRRFAWTVAVLAAGAFVTTVLFALLSARVSVNSSVRKAFGAMLVLIVVGAVGATVTAYGGPSSMARRAVDSIRQPPPPVIGDQTKRLFNLNSSGRLDVWSSALDDAGAHRFLGSGAGTFEEWWLRHRTSTIKVRDAHNLYVEQLAELGSVGLLLLVVALGTPFVAAWRSRSHPLVPVAFGGFVAFLVHAGLDWDWEMPAVTLCGFAFAGSLLLAVKGEARTIASKARLRVVGVSVLLLASAFAFIAFNGNRALSQALSAASDANPAAAARHARTAARWSPWSFEPLRIQADAALEQGALPRARKLYREAIGKDSRNWELWFGLALASNGKAQQRALSRAAKLDPLAPEIQQLRAAGV